MEAMNACLSYQSFPWVWSDSTPVAYWPQSYGGVPEAPFPVFFPQWLSTGQSPESSYQRPPNSMRRAPHDHPWQVAQAQRLKNAGCVKSAVSPQMRQRPVVEEKSGLPSAADGQEEPKASAAATVSVVSSCPLQVKPEECHDAAWRCKQRETAWRWRCSRLKRQQKMYRDTICALERRLREAAKEKAAQTTAFANLLEGVEVAAQKVADEAKVALPAKAESAVAKQPDWVSAARLCKDQFATFLSSLLEVLSRTQKAREVLERVFCCTLSFDVFRMPVLASDGQVYEKGWILQWLNENAVSPLTRKPMRSTELFHDRVVEQGTEALWLLRGQVPDEVDEVTKSGITGHGGLNNRPSQVNSGELFNAIVARDEATALQILQPAQHVASLNGRFDVDKKTLLHMALLHSLPSVAMAIIKHPEFRGHDALMGAPRRVVSPLHIAAALGQHEICKALLQHEGGGIAMLGPSESITVQCYDGLELRLQLRHNALMIALSQGHAEAAAVIQEALDRFASA